MTAAAITHSVPGRMRLRVSGTLPERRTALEALDRRLAGEGDLSTNWRIGSALFTYDPDRLDIDDVVALVRESGQVFRAVVPPSTRRALQRPVSEAAQQVRGRFAGANRTVLDATDGRIDLRMLFPVALAGLAVRQLLRQRSPITDAPWYVLAYYAFDSFVKLHGDLADPTDR